MVFADIGPCERLADTSLCIFDLALNGSLQVDDGMEDAALQANDILIVEKLVLSMALS